MARHNIEDPNNQDEHENASNKGNQKISLEEYLKKIYGAYSSPKNGMLLSNYIGLHQRMLHDLREYHQNIQAILENNPINPSEYLVWLEQTVTATKALFEQYPHYMLKYVITEAGVKTSWERFEAAYQRPPQNQKN